MKILIAIKTCHRYRERAEAQRQTWIPRLVAAIPAGWAVDLKFFVGRPGAQAAISGPDVVALDCDDSYFGLPEKFKGICRWALAGGYDWIFNCDDDVYIVPDRLLASLDPTAAFDYSGRLRGPSGAFPAPYASGFAVWLSRRAITILADAPLGPHRRQDRWVGNILAEHGIRCQRETRFVLVKSSRNVPCAREGARQHNHVIAACEFSPPQMLSEHHAFINDSIPAAQPAPLPAPTPFSRVSVMIKTFLRDGYLVQTARDIERCLPGMKMVIVDDGRESRTKIALYQELARRGHICEWLPFDSGFGAKGNHAIQFLDRDYTLIGSDDFDFAGAGVPEGIRRLISVLDHDCEVGSVAGRVDAKPYEGFVERGADYIRLVPLDPEKAPKQRTADGVEYYYVDHTVNYNLVRSKLLGPGRITYETRTKMGADHFDFYDDLRKYGMKIAWCPGVNINQQRNPALKARNDPKYTLYRGRAPHGVQGFLRKYGIKRFIGFRGHVDELRDPA